MLDTSQGLQQRLKYERYLDNDSHQPILIPFQGIEKLFHAFKLLLP
jgi:hypothetical protein